MSEPIAEQPRMADYGVGGAGWRGLSWSWAAERLIPNRNYWVGTVSASGRPHSLPVWGVWDESVQRFMFSCGPTSRKAHDLADNPQVVVTVDDTVECVSVIRANLVVEVVPDRAFGIIEREEEFSTRATRWRF
jgi:hypothetical protein